MISIDSILDAITLFFEIGGVFILLTSAIGALLQWTIKALPSVLTGTKPDIELRLTFGHHIVFALEFFIAADLIMTIREPTFQELGKLAITVVIRTVLHYSLR